MLLATWISLTLPQVLRLAVDDLYRGVTAEKLGRYALMYIGIALLGAVFRFHMRRHVIGVSRAIEFDLRNDLFAHLQRLPAEYYHAHRTGEIMSRATNDLAAVRMMVGPGVLYLFNTVAVATASIAFMLRISPRLTLYTLIPLPFVSFSVWFFGERIHHRFEAIQSHFATIAARVQENLSGVRVVRAFAIEDREMADFRVLNEEYRRRNLDLISNSGLFHPGLGFLSGLAALLALYLGGREVITGKISLGQFVAFTAYLGTLNWPVVALGWVVSLWQRGLASFARIDEILATRPTVRTRPGARRIDRPRGAIEFRHLTYHYPGSDRPVLRDVSLAIEPGSTVAFVGRTGAGKSTLLHLLPRVFDPPPGTVFLDGHDVLDLELHSLRAAIVAVPQDTFLFSDTLAANISYGTDGAGADEIERAGTIANLHPDVARFPDGWQTRVGERGITLSGGQRQRTAIARALMRGGTVLMLDDCLSSVDTHTEEAILKGLRTEMRRRTSLIVSHRVSTVCDADLIVVLEDGAMVERGTHAELLAHGGRYAGLQRLQQLEEELEAS